MTKIDNYLIYIQEQFNASIALADIHGDFQNDWTDCYEVRCYRRFENKYEKNICKADCQMRAANKAISRINSAKSKCSGASDPNRCKKTLESGVKQYMKKIETFKSSQQKSQTRFRQFQG